MSMEYMDQGDLFELKGQLSEPEVMRNVWIKGICGQREQDRNMFGISLFVQDGHCVAHLLGPSAGCTTPLLKLNTLPHRHFESSHTSVSPKLPTSFPTLMPPSGPQHHVAAAVRREVPPRQPRAAQGRQERQRAGGTRRREEDRQGMGCWVVLTVVGEGPVVVGPEPQCVYNENVRMGNGCMGRGRE